MDDVIRVVSNIFDLRHFEKFRCTDETTGKAHFIYRIDGVEVAEGKWEQAREECIIKDMERFVYKRKPGD